MQPPLDIVEAAASGQDSSNPFRRPTRLAHVHEAAIVLIALIGLALGYLAWRLSIGTVSIQPLVPYVESALEKVVGGQTKIGRLRLGFDPDRRDFVVSAGDITVTADARKAPLALGRVNLTLNARALVLGKAQITRADLSGMQAVLILDKEGRTAFGFGSVEEVLALPRAKVRARGLRSILDTVRKTLLPDRAAGRVEAISLQNGRLTLVDPDTGQRLTLKNARASISANAQNVVTMQVLGGVAEMGGLGNLAVSASPDPNKRLVLAAAFSNANISALPRSVRVGPLARASEIGTPVTGKVLAYLGQEGKPFDVRANLQLGKGRLFGVEIARAAGKFIWDGDTGSFTFEKLIAQGPKTLIDGGTGSLRLMDGGRRAIGFTAQGFDVDIAQFGRIAGQKVSGNGLLDTDMFPRSGGLSGQSLSYTRAGTAQVDATMFRATLNEVREFGGVGQKLLVVSKNVSGSAQDVRFDAQDSKVTLSGTRTGRQVRLRDVAAQAQRLGIWSQQQGQLPRVDAFGLEAQARQFGQKSWLPDGLTFRAAQIQIRNSGSPAVSANANSVAVELAQLSSPGTRLQASIGALSSSIANGAFGPVSGQNIGLDAQRTGRETAQINSLKADSLAFGHPKFLATTADLLLAGQVSRGGLTQTALQASRVSVESPDELLRPFLADNVSATGSLTPNSVELSRFALEHRGIALSGATAITRAPRGSPKTDLTAEVRGDVSVDTLMSAWPIHFLPETREVIRRLVPEGRAQIDLLTLAIPAGMLKKQILPPGGIDLAFRVYDATVTYLTPLTPITGVSGSGVLTGNSLFMDFPTGQIGSTRLSSAKLSIPEFKVAGAHAYIDAAIAGDVTEIAQVIDTQPLGLLAKANLDPQRLSGDGTALVNIDIPLKRDLVGEDILVKVDGKIANAGLARVFAGLDATDGQVTLNVAQGSIKIGGQASIAGNRFDFDWASTAVNGGAAEVSLSAKGGVDIASLKQIGLNLDAYGQGTVDVVVQTLGQGNAFGKADISADFTHANIALPRNAWTKPKGAGGQAIAKLFAREGGGWNVQDLRFDADGMILRGALDLSNSGDLVDARFSRVFIENASDLAVDISRARDGLTVTLRGNYLNLAPFLAKKNVTEQAVDLLDRPLSLSADIAKVSTGKDMDLTGVHAEIERDAIGWRSLFASGQSLAGRSQIELLAGQDGRRTISGVLSDAGFFAQLLYPGAPLSGGTGTIEGELPVVGANSSGNLTFKGKDILLVRAGSAPILFDDIQLLMQVRGGVVTLSDGLANGAAYTVKAAGYVDLGAGKLDVRGLATPGGLNRAFGDIPLLGPILGGGSDEGLLGMTFTAQGSLAEPQVRSNPISALAPGFLRKIFESEAPLSPQPRLVVTDVSGKAAATTWPYGPTLDMRETFIDGRTDTRVGPLM